MPIRIFYKLQMINVKEHQDLFSSPVVKEAVKKHFIDAYALVKTPPTIPTGCLSYQDYVFSFPICWFRAFILMMCLPNRIDVNDLKKPCPQTPGEDVHKKIYDFTSPTQQDISLKKEIEIMLYYILANNQTANVYRYKDDVIMMMLRLLHIYNPTIYTNPGFYGDFVYYYPINMFRDFDIFKAQNIFAVYDRRGIKRNQTAPALPTDKKHLFMMYKYNQPLNVNIGGYGISSIYMLNYNMFKLKSMFNNHAICIYQCQDGGWYTNELDNNVHYGTETGKLNEFTLSNTNDISPTCFHKKFNLKFNIHKGCRIVHYVKQLPPSAATTHLKFTDPPTTITVEFYSLAQFLLNMMRKTNEYEVIIESVNFHYKYTITDDGYEHTLEVTKGTKKETFYFKVSRFNLTFKIEEYVNRETKPVNLADLDRILMAENLSLIGMCNHAITNFCLDRINHKKISTNIQIKTPYTQKVKFTLTDQRRFIQCGGKDSAIIYKNKSFKIRLDTETKQKYIIKNKERIYLSSIRGKYKYTST